MSTWEIGVREGMRKQAVDPLSLLAIGALGHVGVNALAKALGKTGVGRRAAGELVAQGLKRGLRGQELGHTTQSLAKLFAGPEVLVGHDLGRTLGKQLKGKGRTKQMEFLSQLRDKMKAGKELKDIPEYRHMITGIESVLKNPEMGDIAKRLSMAEGTKRTAGSRLATGATAAGLTLLEPSAGVHMGVNVLRDIMAKSPAGRRFASEQLKKGLAGEKLSPARGMAADLLLSPKAMETRRIGQIVRDAALRRGVDPRTLKNPTTGNLLMDRGVRDEAANLYRHARDLDMGQMLKGRWQEVANLAGL